MAADFGYFPPDVPRVSPDGAASNKGFYLGLATGFAAAAGMALVLSRK